jgi:hypothetical protein
MPHDSWSGQRGVADEAEMVAEADGEGLVAGFEDLAEKRFDVFLVLFDQ